MINLINSKVKSTRVGHGGHTCVCVCVCVCVCLMKRSLFDRKYNSGFASLNSSKAYEEENQRCTL